MPADRKIYCLQSRAVNGVKIPNLIMHIYNELKDTERLQWLLINRPVATNYGQRGRGLGGETPALKNGQRREPF